MVHIYPVLWCGVVPCALIGAHGSSSVLIGWEHKTPHRTTVGGETEQPRIIFFHELLFSLGTQRYQVFTGWQRKRSPNVFSLHHYEELLCSIDIAISFICSYFLFHCAIFSHLNIVPSLKKFYTLPPWKESPESPCPISLSLLFFYDIRRKSSVLHH